MKRLYEKGEKEVGPAFIDFFAPLLKARFSGYVVAPLIEQTRELNFDPAESIFSPFGFKVLTLFDQEVIESETEVKTLQILKKTPQNLPKRILLFASRFNEITFKNAVSQLQKAGAKKIVGLFLCGSI